MNILLICADEYMGRRVLRCLDARQHDIFVLSPDKRDPIRFSRFVKKHEIFNFSLKGEDTSYRLQLFADYADKGPFDIVIPCDVWAGRFLSQARGLFKRVRHFPVSDVITLDLLDDKWSFYELAERLSLPSPKTQLLTKKSQIDEISIPSPFVVKPLRQGGGHGFKVFSALEDLALHVTSGKAYSNLPLIVQEFLPGDWMGCNILAGNGKILAYTIQKNYSFEEIDFVYNEQIFDVTKVLVEQTSYTGVAHFDFIYNNEKDELGILECNPRFWNSTYASKWIGVDFVQLGIDLAFARSSKQEFFCEKVSTRKFLSTGFLIRHAVKKGVCWQDLCKNLPNVWGTLKDPMPLLISKLP